MTIEKKTGLGTKAKYGPAKLGEDSAGKYPGAGGVETLNIEFRGGTYSVVEGYLPKGATIVHVVADVDEVFALGGTSPTINVGTKGSASSDGVSLSEAQAEAVGTYPLTPSGTWSSPLAADTAVAVELGGTTPTITEAGHARFTIHYVRG